MHLVQHNELSTLLQPISLKVNINHKYKSKLRCFSHRLHKFIFIFLPTFITAKLLSNIKTVLSYKLKFTRIINISTLWWWRNIFPPTQCRPSPGKIKQPPDQVNIRLEPLFISASFNIHAGQAICEIKPRTAQLKFKIVLPAEKLCALCCASNIQLFRRKERRSGETKRPLRPWNPRVFCAHWVNRYGCLICDWKSEQNAMTLSGKLATDFAGVLYVLQPEVEREISSYWQCFTIIVTPGTKYGIPI